MPKVLVIDDDVALREMVCAILDTDDFDTYQASSGTEGIDIFSNVHPEVVLLDMQMVGESGLETLAKIREVDEYCSVLFLSGNSSTKDIVQGLDAGADDYIVKPFDPGELLARVRTQVRIQTLTQQLKIANQKLKRLVDIDDLTGLYNMRSLYQRMDTELARARRHQRQVVAVMMDLDHFKTVNDNNDHLFGSWVLSQVGKLITDMVRAGDFGARYGGDEFLIVLTDTDTRGANSFCERLRKKIQATAFEHEGNSMDLTASIGFAVTLEGQDIDARALVRAADRCLYDAKRSGRNVVVGMNLEEHVTKVG